MAVQTPQMTGPMVIKANRGEGESPREEDTTADEDGEREMSELSELSKSSEAPATSHAKVKKAKHQTGPHPQTSRNDGIGRGEDGTMRSVLSEGPPVPLSYQGRTATQCMRRFPEAETVVSNE